MKKVKGTRMVKMANIKVVEVTEEMLAGPVVETVGVTGVVEEGMTVTIGTPAATARRIKRRAKRARKTPQRMKMRRERKKGMQQPLPKVSGMKYLIAQLPLGPQSQVMQIRPMSGEWRLQERRARRAKKIR